LDKLSTLQHPLLPSFEQLVFAISRYCHSMKNAIMFYLTVKYGLQ